MQRAEELVHLPEESSLSLITNVKTTIGKKKKKLLKISLQ